MRTRVREAGKRKLTKMTKGKNPRMIFRLDPSLEFLMHLLQ